MCCFVYFLGCHVLLIIYLSPCFSSVLCSAVVCVQFTLFHCTIPVCNHLVVSKDYPYVSKFALCGSTLQLQLWQLGPGHLITLVSALIQHVSNSLQLQLLAYNPQLYLSRVPHSEGG